MNTVIWWESQIERDYIYLLEIDPDVLSYKEQPFTLSYPSQGKLRKYTPDFWVERRVKKQVVEVKPQQQVESQSNLHLFPKIASICHQLDLEFVVVTETMIRVQPKLDNIKLLMKYSRVSLSATHRLDCLQYFHSQKSRSLQQAEQDLRPVGMSRPILLRLLYEGWLVTDLMQPLRPESLLQLAPEGIQWKQMDCSR